MRRKIIEKVHEEMERRCVGAVLCFHPANTRYLTGVYTLNYYIKHEPMNENYVLVPRTSGPILYNLGHRLKRMEEELVPWLER